MSSTITDRLNGLTTSVAVKAPCRVATTANITLSGTQTIDGVAVVAGDRVLVKNQTSAVDNGIWVCGAGTWARATDFDGTFDAVGGTRVSVISGTVNANSEWRTDGDGAIVIGTDSVVWERATVSSTIYIDTENFDGSTIPDDSTAQEALQALETAVEAVDAELNATRFPTKAALEAATVPAAITELMLDGYTTVGDGLGGLYIDTDNSSTDTITSADARVWYRAEDVSYDRLHDGLRTAADAQASLHNFEREEGVNTRVQLRAPAPAANRAVQGITFVPQTGEWYYTMSTGTAYVNETTTVVRADESGAVVDYSSDAATLGHPQDISHLYWEGDLTFVSSNEDGDGCCFFEYTNGTAQAIANTRVYQLCPTGTTYATPNLSADKRHLAVYYGDDDDKLYIRIFNVRTLLEGATGDRSSEYIREIELTADPDYDGSAASNLHGQSCAMDENYVYALNGYISTANPKYLSAFRISDGTMVYRKEITAGKAWAQTKGGGTTYEPEGLEWVWGHPSLPPTLWMAMSVDNGSGRDNYAIPIIDSFGALSTNGDTTPLGIGMFFSGGGHDLVYRSGTYLQFSKYSPADPPSVTAMGYVRGDNDRFEWLKSIISTAFQTKTMAIADDAFDTVTLPASQDGNNRSCVAIVTSSTFGNGAPRGIFSARSGISAQIHSIAFAQSGTNVTLTTGALAGTTGADGDFTISVHTDGSLYFENRTATAQTITVLLIGHS